MTVDLPPGCLTVNKFAFNHMVMDFYGTFIISQGRGYKQQSNCRVSFSLAFLPTLYIWTWQQVFRWSTAWTSSRDFLLHIETKPDAFTPIMELTSKALTMWSVICILGSKNKITSSICHTDESRGISICDSLALHWGAWERIITSIWELHTALPDDPQVHTVTIDDLRTMLAGVQRIMNTRNLTAINNSSDNQQAFMTLNFITNTSDTSAMEPITDSSTPVKLLAGYWGIHTRVHYFWRR